MCVYVWLVVGAVRGLMLHYTMFIKCFMYLFYSHYLFVAAHTLVLATAFQSGRLAKWLRFGAKLLDTAHTYICICNYVCVYV